MLEDNWAVRFGDFETFEGSPNDPTSRNYQGSSVQRIDDLVRRGYGNDTIEYWIEYEKNWKPIPERTDVFDLAVTKGKGKPFDKMTLERIEKQEEAFTDSTKDTIVATSALIPLGIIAFLVFKK